MSAPLFSVGQSVVACGKHEGCVIQVWPKRPDNTRTVYDVEFPGHGRVLKQIGQRFRETDLEAVPLEEESGMERARR